jgi:hypothetical protein
MLRAFVAAVAALLATPVFGEDARGARARRSPPEDPAGGRSPSASRSVPRPLGRAMTSGGP